jgi:DNA-binding MarR family transcriptional regulator
VRKEVPTPSVRRRRRPPPAARNRRLTDALEGWAVFRFERAAAALADDAQEALWEHSLTLTEFAALVVLVDRLEIRQSALRERLALDRSRVCVLVDELEEEGLAARRPHPIDRRRVIVEITALGKERVRAASRSLARAEHRFLAPLREDEQDELREMLRRLEPPPYALGDLYAQRPGSTATGFSPE